jgi:hypothetical protein
MAPVTIERSHPLYQAAPLQVLGLRGQANKQARAHTRGLGTTRTTLFSRETHV